jgi:hypothetical protein
MTTGEQGENGRVTLAIIQRDILALTETVKTLAAEVKEANRCQGDHSTRITVLERRFDTHAEEISTLRARDTAGTWITGAMAVIAGVIGAWFKP